VRLNELLAYLLISLYVTLCSGLETDEVPSSMLTEFRWHGGSEDLVQYMAADVADAVTVQSLFAASFTSTGVHIIGVLVVTSELHPENRLKDQMQHLLVVKVNCLSSVFNDIQ